jgi:predicted  nucleic acid-binding Zn-ribbon protein
MGSHMRAEVEALLILQDRDQKIASLKLQQTSAPKEKRNLETRLAAARDSLEQARQRVRENEVERRKLELEVEGKRTAITRFKTQQQQTRKNEEFQALTTEIQHAEDSIHALEDRELVLMEQAEELQRAAAAAEAETARTQGIIRDQLDRLEATSVATAARLKELESDHAQLAEKVDPDALFLYERLFAKKGDAAVVALEHEICSGCHMKVPTQIASQVRGDQALTQCPNCGRILYRVI